MRHESDAAPLAFPTCRLWRRAVVALAVAPVLALAACGDSKPAQKSETGTARPVLTQPVRYTSLSAARTFVAVVKPRIEADLGFRVGGKILKRLVDVGATVKPGDALALLDETDLRLQLEQAQAELTAAKSALTTAETELQRRTALNRQGYSTQTNLDQQRAVTDEARGRLTKGERALQLAQNALSYTKLISDTEGVVTASLVEPGQVVSAGQVMMRVARTSEREALAAIPEAFVDGVRSGKASVSLWSSPGKQYRAELRELSPAADAATRTYAARFSLPDAGADVAWGMTATVSIAEAAGVQAAQLPLSALFSQGTGAAVWAVDRTTGALTLKPVVVVKYDGASVFVASGVAEGEDIVTLGVHKLDLGQKVRIVSALPS